MPSFRVFAPCTFVRNLFVVVVLVLFACLAVGCVQVKDTLTINPDGSGSIEIQTACFVPDLATYREYRGGGPASAAMYYPPMSARDAKLLFPESDFTVHTDFTRPAAGQTLTVVKVTFKDVNKLLASPYAQAHSLWIGLDDARKTLTVKALTGFQSVPNLDAMGKNRDMMLSPAMLKKAQANADKLRVDFTLKLPAPPKAEGAVVDANSATWTVDHAVVKDGAKLAQAFRTRVVATCSSENVTFKPVSPLRLDLASFADLPEGLAGEKPAPVDMEKVKASAKFVPLAFMGSRTFYFSGDSTERDSASLTGLVVIPRDLAPYRWGAVDLTTATDDQGTALTLNERERGYMSGYSHRYTRDRDGTQKPDPDVRYPVTIPMKTPAPTAKSLKTVNASIELKYPGAPVLIKLKDSVALPKPKTKAAKADPNAEEDDDTSYENNRSQLSHPKLDELGLKLTVQQVYSRGDGMISVSLSCEGDKALVSNIQAFDAKGVPVPTMLQSGYGESSLYFNIMDSPDGPLSLALVLTSDASTYKLPIVLQNLPITPNELKPLAKPPQPPNNAPATATPPQVN